LATAARSSISPRKRTKCATATEGTPLVSRAWRSAAGGAGVPYITVNYQGDGIRIRRTSRRCAAAFQSGQGDGGPAAGPLRAGLLDSTIVWWSGEFGRTPKVQWRLHERGRVTGTVFSRSCRGGFAGGQVVGPRMRARRVKDRPVYRRPDFKHLYATGIDLHASLPHPLGQSVFVAPIRKRT